METDPHLVSKRFGKKVFLLQFLVSWLLDIKNNICLTFSINEENLKISGCFFFLFKVLFCFVVLLFVDRQEAFIFHFCLYCSRTN
jgi:hypothetical protein